MLPVWSSASTSATVTTSISFELASSHLRVTSTKFTKQEWVSQWVSESVTDEGKQWSDSGPIKIIAGPSHHGQFSFEQYEAALCTWQPAFFGAGGEICNEIEIQLFKNIYKRNLVKNLRHLPRGEKEQRRKGRIYLEKEYICSAEEKKNGEGKGWKYVWEGRCQDGIVKDTARILDSEFVKEKKKNYPFVEGRL